MTPFSFPEFLLAIASAAALLVWSVRLVRTGFERAFGPELRAGLRKSTSNRVYAALTGAVAAFLLQSATGVSVLVAGFMSSSAIAPLPAFAMLRMSARRWWRRSWWCNQAFWSPCSC